MKYGPWAVVAGASEGIGAAFAKALAAQGVKLILVARRAAPLQALAKELSVETKTVEADLSTLDGLQAVFNAAEGNEVGLVVANAAVSPIGPFTTKSAAELQQVLDLNCRAPMLLAHHFLPAMYERQRGGFILMSSLAGQQGSPGLAAYAGSKAFGAVFAESLWFEAAKHHVDVLTVLAGAVETPNLQSASTGRAPGTVQPTVVAQEALKALGRKPRTVPGAMMKFSAQLMTRLLPRKTAIKTIARASGDILA